MQIPSDIKVLLCIFICIAVFTWLFHQPHIVVEGYEEVKGVLLDAFQKGNGSKHLQDLLVLNEPSNIDYAMTNGRIVKMPLDAVKNSLAYKFMKDYDISAIRAERNLEMSLKDISSGRLVENVHF